MVLVHNDCETQSEADLKKIGAPLYAEHFATRVACWMFAVNDGPVYSLDQFCMDCPMCDHLYSLAANPEVLFMAHNAPFEQNIWRAQMVPIGFPEIHIDRWRCTMAKAYAHSLPGGLEAAGAALGLDIQKDKDGHRIMMKLCRPRKDGRLWEYADCPDDFEKLYRYCKQDVESERELNNALRDLSPAEQQVWFIDQRINQDGILLDIPTIERAVRMSERHQLELHTRFNNLTNGEVGKPTQRAKFKAWLAKNHVNVADTQKSTITKVLAEDDGGMAAHVAKALETVIEANRTSLAKYRAMLERSKDGILREILQYHGAHTGRWAGRGVQLQNLPRPLPGVSTTQVIETLSGANYDLFAFLYVDVAQTISRALRGMVIAPPEHELFMADFAQVEARVLAWLAGQQEKLDLFTAGADLYCMIAEKIFGYAVTKKMEERQVGKVADLAFGYGGGIGAGANMMRGYGVDLKPVYPAIWESASDNERGKAEWSYENYLQRRPEEPIDRENGYALDIIKQRWRATNPKIVAYWGLLEASAIAAVETGKVFECNRTRWFVHGKFLYCKLPSGRMMAYPYPEVTEDQRGNPKLTYFGPIPGTNSWGRIGTYGGKLSENVVQAVSRDLLAEAIVRSEDKYPVAFHTHDEMVSVVREGFGSLSEFVELMEQQPTWADGLPIAVDGWSGKRYGK